MRARLGQAPSAKQEAGLRETVEQLQHKEGKLSATSQSYLETERLLHRDLSTLLSDARWLRHYGEVEVGLRGGLRLGWAGVGVLVWGGLIWG